MVVFSLFEPCNKLVICVPALSVYSRLLLSCELDKWKKMGKLRIRLKKLISEKLISEKTKLLFSTSVMITVMVSIILCT